MFRRHCATIVELWHHMRVDASFSNAARMSLGWASGGREAVRASESGAGGCNPYAVIFFGDAMLRTDTIPLTPSPVWKQAACHRTLRSRLARESKQVRASARASIAETPGCLSCRARCIPVPQLNCFQSSQRFDLEVLAAQNVPLSLRISGPRR